MRLRQRSDSGDESAPADYSATTKIDSNYDSVEASQSRTNGTHYYMIKNQISSRW